MKALVKKEGAQGLWLEEIPIPIIAKDEVLIKVHKTSICGTDAHIYKWDAWAQKRVPIPMVIGHEFMGVIAEVGSNVNYLKVGQRVSGEGHIVCHHCPACLSEQKHLCPNTLGVGVQRQGCFAEYFYLPAENVFVLPDNVSDHLAAVFDPFGNAVHTSLSTNLTGEDVLITGAGAIGIMAAAIARKSGARSVVITDLNPYHLNLALAMGASRAVNIKIDGLEDAMKELGISYGFGVGMEMSGSANALRTQIEFSRNGGHISLLGFIPPDTGINWDQIIFKMLTIKGIYGREIFKTWIQMVHLLDAGLELEPIITHHFSAYHFQEAFDVLLSGNSGKIILNWT